MSEIGIGAVLLRSPQLERTFLSLSRVLSPLWHLNICVTSLVGCPQYLVHSGVVHGPLVAINFPVSSYLDASLTARMSYLGGAFLWLYSACPNLLEDGMSHEVCLFCANGLEGFF